MRWDKKQLHLGIVTVGQRREVIFQALEEIPEVDFIQTTCGCTSAKYDTGTKQLKAIYKAKPIPMHLRGKQNYYNTTQTITINYVNGEKEFFTFGAKVWKK